MSTRLFRRANNQQLAEQIFQKMAKKGYLEQAIEAVRADDYTSFAHLCEVMTDEVVPVTVVDDLWVQVEDLYMKRLSSLRRRFATVFSYDDLINRSGWDVKVESWDIPEGAELWSWEGPEAAGPAGVDADLVAAKVINGVRVVAKVKASYEAEEDEELQLTVATATITSLLPEDFDVDDEDLDGTLSDMASEIAYIALDAEPKMLREFRKQAERFQSYVKRFRGRWHIYR